jgi:pimeloyl-ACP methyl ester carboxylesterase
VAFAQNAADDPGGNRPRRHAGVARVYVALGIAGLVAGMGLAYEAAADYRDHRRFPREGDLIAVGLHRMHLYCTGQGGPAVILEAPQTGLSALWRPVQEAVSRLTRVCSYDRAGFGWSEPGPAPRTSKQIALELHALLAQAGVPPPYVLVGFSFGGFHVRVYAGQFPAEVAGVVLVDASHPDQAARLHLPEDPTQPFKKWEPFIPLMHRFGILRIGLHYDEPALASLPKDVRGEILYLRDKTSAYRTLSREGAAWAESADQVRKSGDLGAKPLIVLTGGRVAEPAWRTLWVDGLQAEMVHLSSRGKQIVLNNSGHGIPFDAPDAAVDAIQEICNVVHADESKK